MELNSLPENLDHIAFDLFRYWTLEAQKHFPDLSFSIIDESKLVMDLKNSMTTGLECLFKKDRKIRNLFKGSYDIGFMYGFIHSNLNCIWYFEYIIKQSREYREITILSAICRFLERDNLAEVQISEDYSELLREYSNLKNSTNHIPELHLDLDSLTITIHQQNSCNYNFIRTAIENIRITKILQCTKRKYPNFLPEIDPYFEDQQISRFIKDNEGPACPL